MVSCLPLCFIFPQNFKHLYSSAQCLLRKQNLLERGVVGVTSVLRSGPKTNINTVKHKCYHLVERIFWLPKCVTQLSPLGEEPSVCLYIFQPLLKFSENKVSWSQNVLSAFQFTVHPGPFIFLHPLSTIVAAHLSRGRQHNRKQIQIFLFTSSSISSNHFL